MIVSLIVAVAENRVIGKDNDLIWNLPKDMRFFKEKTTGHHVIMGRKNFESIPEKYRPLPNRTNIIVTRKQQYDTKNILTVNSVKEGIEIAKRNNDKEPFIIGGGEIYELSLKEDLVDKIYLTKLHKEFSGDTFFPILDKKWKEINRVDVKADENHECAFSFLTYVKKINF